MSAYWEMATVRRTVSARKAVRKCQGIVRMVIRHFLKDVSWECSLSMLNNRCAMDLSSTSIIIGN
jgi:hypothetical protein